MDILNETNLKDFAIPLQNGDLYYVPAWLNASTQNSLYENLKKELSWSQDEIKVYGKWHKIPRLQAWHGDCTAIYQYSNTNLVPNAWTPSLSFILNKLSVLNSSFNSVLANWYRTGHDKMGWHSDNERELGQCPTIASVSLGAERSFHLRHRVDGTRINVELQSGSLLVMAGELQKYWQHALPVRRRVSEGRINLTFRQVMAVLE